MPEDSLPEREDLRPERSPSQDAARSPAPSSRPPAQWQPPTPEELQEQISEYKILDLLGRGGMGAVYQGWQTSLERYVAIKILPPDVDDEDSQFTARFKQEARTMAKFQHPGIVSIYDAGETPSGLLYIVMEFIEGTDVSKMIKSQSRLPPGHALAIAAHVCDALQYAHNHGVIHRDIKPANVLMNMEGEVKVADFGLAKSAGPSQGGLTRSNVAMGTPDYLAPEVLIPGLDIDGRADIYALGVMLYDMLTGRVPRGMFEMPSVVTRGESDVRFDHIIAKAMEQDREKRYQTAHEIRQDLDVILTTPKLEARGPGSSAIPKHELAVIHQGRVHQKPVARRPGELARLQAKQVVTYVPRRRSSLPALGAGIVLAVGAFFGWQKFKGHLPQSAATSSSSAATPAQTAAGSSTPMVQPDGVLTFEGHRYKYLPGPFAKYEDRDKAALLGGHLVTITSEQEQKWIEQTFAGVISVNSKGGCCTGGRREDGATDWTWPGDVPWNHTNWDTGHPKIDTHRQVMVLKQQDGSLKWQNMYWENKRAALVEWDDLSTPIPSWALSAPLASARPAPADALPFGGHRYKLIRGVTSWNEASERASGMGGHLATLTTREESEWVGRTFVSNLPADRLVHIGGFKPAGNGVWLWMTGETWSFENWGKGKAEESPDPRGLTYMNFNGSFAHWAAKWSPGSMIEIGSGSDQGQSRVLGFVVEWDDDLTESLPLAGGTSAPGDSFAFGGHRYQFAKEKARWSDAKARAEATGGHLATITTREERDALTKNVVIPKGQDQHVFLGGLQEKSGGPWTWVTGEPFDMSLWGEAGPDGSGPRLTFYADSKLGKSWDDVHNNSVFPFVVEWDDDRGSGPLATTLAPADGLEFGGHRYKMVPDKIVSWSQAKAAAEAMGGHLATITSREENDWLANSVIAKLEPGLGLWIGGTSQGTPGKWRWITGEAFTFTDWAANEPMNSEIEPALVFKKADDLTLGWGDIKESGIGKKDRRGGFLVEWDAAGTLGINTPGLSGAIAATAGAIAIRLVQLDSQFKDAYERDAQRDHRAAIADLDGKYLAAIDRALADATKAGKLEEVVAFRDEKQRVANKATLPAADPVNITGGLKKLRDTYRATLLPLTKKRAAAAEPVYARYDHALAAFQTELTQKNAISEAQIVQGLRDALDKQRHPGTAEPLVAETVQATPTPAPSKPAESTLPSKDKPKKDTSPAGQLPPEMLNEPVPKPFTPQEAMQWALALGGSAKIKKGSVESEVLSLAKMPKGSYSVIGLKLGEKQPLHVVSLAALSGLNDLRELSLDSNLLTDAGLAFLPKLPKLTHLSLNRCSITDAGLEHLAKQQGLTHLGLGDNKISGSGLRSIAGLQSLNTLDIGSPSLADEHISLLGSFGGLTTLDLSGDKALSCTSLAPLTGLKSLKRIMLGKAATDEVVQSLGSLVLLDTLDLNHATISDYALERMGSMKGLRELNFYDCPNLTDVGFAKLQPLKGLLRLNLGHTRLTDSQFVTLSSKLSELAELNINTNGMSDAGLAGLANLRKISHLNIHVRMCTDLGLGYVRRLANLRVIGIDQMNTLSPARMDALRRGLPSVDFGKR